MLTVLGCRQNTPQTVSIGPESAPLRVPPANHVLALLLGIEFLLAALYVLSSYLGGVSTFDLNAENSVSNWFSSVQLILLAILLFALSRRECARGETQAARAIGVLSLAFVFFSLDEVAQIHEKITVSLKHYEAIPRVRGDHGIWIFVYSVIALGILLLIGPGLWRYARRNPANSLRFGAGGLILVVGAVGMEILGDMQIFVGSLEVLSEEIMEMSGVSVMVWACLRDLEAAPVRICTAPPPSRPSRTSV